MTATATVTAKERGDVRCEKLAEDHDLVRAILDKYVENWKRSHPGDKKARNYFYNSDVGRCPRSIYYQFYSPEKKKDMAASTIMMFKLGDLFHDELQAMLGSLGYMTNKDIEFGTWSKVGFLKRGRLDVMLRYPTMLVIGEIKSKNPYGFDSPPDNPEIDQLLTYMHDCKNDPYFRERGDKIADIGYIFYMDRGGLATPPICIWEVRYSKDRIKAIEKEFRALHRAIKGKQIPDRPYEMESVPCTYCRFQMSICWKGFAVAEEPKHEADVSIEPPGKEIVDSMAEACIRLKDEIEEKQGELDMARSVLTQYFKATGTSEILPKLGGKIRFSKSKITTLKEDYLLRKLKDKWHLFAKPTLSLLKLAVKEGKVDATTYQRALKFGWSDGSVTITRPKPIKEAKNANKKIQKSV